jgi:antitoxin component YwqK of YwqJK toxin-antitoxin module
MKFLTNWYIWNKTFGQNRSTSGLSILEFKASEVNTTNPDIEYSKDSEGNPVEFNKKTRVETTYHKTKVDSKGNKLPIKRGKYDANNNKILLWQEWNYEKDSSTKKYYVNDKLDGLVVTTFETGPIEKEVEGWEDGIIIRRDTLYRDGRKMSKEFEDGKTDKYRVRMFDTRGKISEEGVINSGKREGIWRWYKSGEFLASMYYYQGQPKGWGEDPSGNKIKGTIPKK